MTKMQKRVFITGEQGNLAHYLAEKIRSNNDFECVWGHFINEPTLCSRKTRFGQELDITDEKAVAKAIKLTEPDIIVHTAAVVGTEHCAKYAQDAYEVNVMGTYNVCKAMGPGMKMVYFSTTATYKPTDKLITEVNERGPQTTYGKTKYFGELLVKQMTKKPLIILPCFIFGGDRDYTVSAIARLARNYNEGNPRIEEVKLSLDNFKDYMYVSDFIDAIYKLIVENPCGEFNISAGRPAPFAQVLSSIIKYGTPRCSIQPAEDYLGNHVVSNVKLRNLIHDWIPQVTLDEGIKRVFEDDTRK